MLEAYMSSATGNQRRASIPEVVGAWLHLWTPPRDVVIPPVPWRKLALGAGIGALVLGVALAVMIPRINDGKEKRAAQERVAEAKADAANRARVTELQKPRSGSASQLLPPAGASATEVSAAREDLLHNVESAITADAQARAAKGEMSRVQGPTTCAPVAGGREGVFDCYTVVRKVPKVETNAAGSIGYPFRAVLDYEEFSYAFCRVEQFPGEKLVPDPSQVVQLPAACQGS
jgi:hypothetical protein